MTAQRVRIVVTTGKLGSDHTHFVELALYTPQGRAAMRRWVQNMANHHGIAAIAQTHHDWRNFTGKALYGAIPTR